MFSVKDFFFHRKLGHRTNGIHQLYCDRYDPSNIEARDITGVVAGRSS